MRDFAERLIFYETRRTLSKTQPQAGFPACEKLRPHLVPLIGYTGFRLLLSRALAMAHADVAWLGALHVRSDGALEGLEELFAQLAPDEMLEGEVVLLAELLGLLVGFIGEALTRRLVVQVWPKIPLNDLELVSGTKVNPHG
jgi:hypothetical protein